MQRLTLHQRQTIQELLLFDITPRYHQPGRDYWFEFESWDIGVQKKRPRVFEVFDITVKKS